MRKISVLLIGESWFVHTMEAKGFDVFTFDRYEEAAGYLRTALESEDIEFHHMPSHRVEQDFPATPEGLKRYDVVLLSDVGANTFQLPMSTFVELRTNPNKLGMLRDYVADGGGFGMIGGYLSFMGIQGRAAYRQTPVAEVLPVVMEPFDDRVEVCQGFRPAVVRPEHPVLQGVKGPFPTLLGYNKLTAKEGAECVLAYGDDPILTLGTFGKGHTAAYATDCSPHWSPVEFCEWEYYPVLWRNLVSYLAGRL